MSKITKPDISILIRVFRSKSFKSPEFKDLVEKYSREEVLKLYSEWKKLRHLTNKFWTGRQPPLQNRRSPTDETRP